MKSVELYSAKDVAALRRFNCDESHVRHLAAVADVGQRVGSKSIWMFTKDDIREMLKIVGKYFTARQVAEMEEFQCIPRRVRQLAAMRGVGQHFGEKHTMMFTREDIEQMLPRKNGGAGHLRMGSEGLAYA